MNDLPEIMLDEEACNLFELHRGANGRLSRYELWRIEVRGDGADSYPLWLQSRLREWSDFVGRTPAPDPHYGTPQPPCWSPISEEENDHFDAFLIQHVTRTERPK